MSNLFKKLAMFLYKRVCIKRLPFFAGRQVESDLIQLHPGENLEWVKTEYYVDKLSMFIMILLVGILLAAAAELNAKSSELLKEGESLERASPGEGETQVDVKAYYGEESYDFRLRLAERMPGKKEADGIMEELAKMLPNLILGKNESLQSVSSPLNLQESYEAFPVTIEWESSRPDLVDELGEIQPVEEAEELLLKAVFTCGEYGREETVALKLVPETLTEEEVLYKNLEEYLLDSEKSSRQEESWQLPQVWEGQELKWTQKRESRALLFMALTIAAAILVYVFSDRDLHKKLEKRKAVLGKEYPELVHELVLLVGAGMTTRGAFQKMALDYEKKKAAKGKISLAYEEILYTCREMQSGIAEGAAYERFGRRTGLQQYVRLSGLLIQNLKRGNSSLPERLREEAYKAGEERLQQGKRLGEEAGTKLLLPMAMLLGVVMLLIIVPAFSAL